MGDAVARLWRMWQELAEGRVRDLAPTRPDDPTGALDGGGLTVLLGLGRRLFGDEHHMPAILSSEQRPLELTRLLPGAANPFEKLRWAPSAKPQDAQGDFFIQIFGASELVVNRAIVEAQKLIDDHSLPLRIATFYRGAHRPDGRSWIDFHDGISNMKSAERRVAIEIPGAEPAWLRGGTFTVYLRIQVDLKAWRSLAREQQEMLVGRHKLTGCPVVGAEVVDGRPVLAFQPGCHTSLDVPENIDAGFIDPAPAAGLARTSHIHRSNFNRGSASADGNNRIYRQGYEFLEPGPSGALELGLNFVSFQRSVLALRRILGTGEWMGDVNFGGTHSEPQAAPPLPLMSLLAGGIYAVPPRDDPFPGAALFG